MNEASAVHRENGTWIPKRYTFEFNPHEKMNTIRKQFIRDFVFIPAKKVLQCFCCSKLFSTFFTKVIQGGDGCFFHRLWFAFYCDDDAKWIFRSHFNLIYENIPLVLNIFLLLSNSFKVGKTWKVTFFLENRTYCARNIVCIIYDICEEMLFVISRMDEKSGKALCKYYDA